MGGYLDKGATNRPNVYRQYLNTSELVAMLRGGVYRRLVQLLPQAATAQGYTLTDDSGEQNPMTKELRDLDVMGNFRRADEWGRCLGESILWMVTDDPAPLDQPLDPTKVTKLHRLQLYDRDEITALTYITDAREGEVGDPLLYSITPRRAGNTTGAKVVHYSRVLRFYGDDLPPSRLGNRSGGRYRWGADAIGQTLWAAVNAQSTTSAAGAHLAQELSISVFTFAGVTGKTKGEKFKKRGRDVNKMKSLWRSIWLSTGDKYERVAANPTGFRDLSESARVFLQMVSGYPGELLSGLQPSGLGTDGKSWQVAWGAKVAAYQQDRYQRNLERLIEVVYYAVQGALPKQWAVAFDPLAKLTETELADLRVKHTMADTDAIDAGILKEKEARTRYEDPAGFVLDLQVEEIEEKEVIEAAPPRIGEISAAIELGRSLAKGELTSEQVRVIAEQQLKLSPEVAAALAVPPALLLDPSMSGDRADFGEPGKAVVWFPLSQQALARHRELQEQAAAIVGTPLDIDTPHMTALYVGAIEDAEAQELAAIVEGVARRHPHSSARARSVDTFTSPEGTAIVLVLDAYDAERIEHELGRAACHLVTAKQAGRSFVPHITLGYVPRQLSAQETASLRDLHVGSRAEPWTVSLSALEVVRNGTAVEYPLRGERNDAGNQGVEAK